jgi:uncharacterized membrane protein
MTTFRIHFKDRTTIDVDAENPDRACDIAKERRQGIVKKVKVLKESAND